MPATRHIRYDNLTSAVQKVIYGQSRAWVENPRWVLFRSHFEFDLIGVADGFVVVLPANAADPQAGDLVTALPGRATRTA